MANKLVTLAGMAAIILAAEVSFEQTSGSGSTGTGTGNSTGTGTIGSASGSGGTGNMRPKTQAVEEQLQVR